MTASSAISAVSRDSVNLVVLIGESRDTAEIALEAVIGASRPGKLEEEFPVRLSASATYVCASATLNRNVIVRSPLALVDPNGEPTNLCASTSHDRAHIELFLPASDSTTEFEQG